MKLMKISFLLFLMTCLVSNKLFADQMPADYVSVYSLKSETEITPLEVGAKASYQLLGPANGWGDLADYDLSKYRKLVINFTFDPADAGNMVAVRFNVNSAPGSAQVKLEKFTLPTEGTDFSAVIDLEKYAEDGKVGVGGIVFYNGAAHWSFNYDEGTATSLPVTINYVALADEIIEVVEMPEDYVSVYSLKPDTEITPLEVGAKASYQLLGPSNGWGDLADYDFSKYRKLVINFTFDPSDAGNMVAVRFNVNSVPGGAQVKLEKFTLPTEGTNFSAEIDLEKYAEEGKVGVGGIVFYNGAAHWSFNYDEGTATSSPVTINYVALADEIVDLTQIPEGYVSVYSLKSDTELAPLEIGAQSSYQLLGPSNGWGDLADYDFSQYQNLLINFTFDPADAGNMVAVRFNVNSVPGGAQVKLEKFTLPTEGTNFSAQIDLEQYAEDGKVGVGGIVFYNGASHWSFNYDEGTATALPVTINYVAVGPVKEDTTKNEVLVSSIEISGDASVAIGKTIQLTATVTPSEATDTTFTWSINDSTIATIDQNGVIAGIAEGTVTVTVTANDASGVSATLEIEVFTEVGVEEFGNAVAKVYPIPASNKLTIEMNQLEVVEILDLSGRSIQLINTNSDKTSIDVSSMNKGIYILKISDSNNQTVIKRVTVE